MELENIMLAVIVVILTITLLVVIISSVWKIYQKAGYEGWECIVPIYGQLIFLKIIGKPWWWIFLLNLTPINVIWNIWSTNLFRKRFGKDIGFTLGLIFLPFVFLPILAFSNAKYIPVGQSAPPEEPLTW